MLGFSYWFLPLFSGCVWLGTLLAMLGRWCALGYPHYSYMPADQHIVLISDVGATSWGYPLFIAGSATSVVVFDLAFISERWLRHTGRLTRNYNTSEKILSGFAIAFSIIGALGLIFLTIFDLKDYPHVHDSMLYVFIAGYIVSAIFICAEYQRLGVRYREERILAASFWIKLAFIFIEIGLVIAFGVLELHDQYYASAPLEWIVSLVFIFYQWSFILDFLPALHTKSKQDRYLPPVRRKDDATPETTEAGGNMLGGPVYSNGGYVQETGPAGASRNF